MSTDGLASDQTCPTCGRYVEIVEVIGRDRPIVIDGTPSLVAGRHLLHDELMFVRAGVGGHGTIKEIGPNHPLVMYRIHDCNRR